MLGWRISEFASFRETLEIQVPGHIFDLWFDGRDEIPLIVDKYELTEWQKTEYASIQAELFLEEIRVITLPNEIKKRLKIKDQDIADSIALDTAIHMLSKAGDYFLGTDNLIKSLGGEDAYWKKYSSDYWKDTITAEPLITSADMEDARNVARKEISKAGEALKRIENEASKKAAPNSYSHAHSIFAKAKENLKSEDYDLIYESECLAKDVVDSVNKAKEKTAEYEKKNNRCHAMESNLSRLNEKIDKYEDIDGILTKSVFVGIFFLILAFAFGSIFFYFLFALIMGINMCHSEPDHDIGMKVISIVMGTVVAPLLILNWGAKDSRNRELEELYTQRRKLDEQLNEELGIAKFLNRKLPSS